MFAIENLLIGQVIMGKELTTTTTTCSVHLLESTSTLELNEHKVAYEKEILT